MQHVKDIVIGFIDNDLVLNRNQAYYRAIKNFLITASTSPEGIKEINNLMEKIQEDGLESLRRIELVTLIELFTGKILVYMTKPDMQKTFIDSLQFVWMDGGPKEELIRAFKTFVIKEYKLYYNG